MMTGTAVVALVAAAGWLFLNVRALNAHGLSGRQKAMMAGAWLVLFAATAFLFDSISR